MTPHIILISGIPIAVIVLVIVGIIRLIIRLSKNKSNDNPSTTYTNYNPPQTGNYNQGNSGPAANPYGQHGPYNQPGSNYPPTNPNVPPAYQSPGTYTPPNYSQTGTNPQTTTRRSTQIPSAGQYAAYTQDQPKNPNRAGLIIGIIAGVIVLVGALGWFIFSKASSAAKLTTSDFKLAYENPTDETYTIILDDWDTIKVDPHTASTDLDYTYDMKQDSFHWKMISANGTVIADTSGLREDLESFYYDQIDKGYSTTPTILFNPSRTEYVFWTLWYGDEGTDYCEDMMISDSTYWIDAFVTNEAIIFDVRDPETATEMGDAKKYSSESQAQFLVNVTDFAILYERIYSDVNDELDVFNEYRNSLIELYNAANDRALADGTTSYNEDKILNEFDLLIPPSVNENTVPRDFVDVIDFLKTEPDFFQEADYSRYNAIIDSADIILKHSFTEQARSASFPEMTYVTYYVMQEGFWNDIPRREISYTRERDRDGKIEY